MTRTLKIIIFALIALVALPVSAQVDAKACTGIDPAQGVPDNCLALMNAFPNPTVTKVRRWLYHNITASEVQVFDARCSTRRAATLIPPSPPVSTRPAVDALGEGWTNSDGGCMQLRAKVQPSSEFRGVQTSII